MGKPGWLRWSIVGGRSIAASPRAVPIGFRLFLGFVAIIGLITVIGVVAVERLRAVTDTTMDINTHDLPEVASVGQIRTLLFQARDLERHVKVGQETLEPVDIATMSKVLANLAHDRAALLALDPPPAGTTSPVDGPTIQKLTDAIARNDMMARQVIQLVQHGDLPAARSLELQQEPVMAAALAQAANLRGREQAEAAAATVDVQRSSSTAARLVFGLTVLSVPLSLLLAVLITRSLTRPIAALVDATDALAAGDLDVAFHVSSGDEIGRLGAAFETMRGNLRTTIASLGFERRQVQAIIDASIDGVVLVGHERTIVRFNPGAERLSGWPAAEALGRPCWEVFGCRGSTSEEAAEHERCCPLLLFDGSAGQPATTIHARLRDGTRRWLAMSCAPVRQDDAVEPKVVLGIHDITQLKAAEQVKSDFVAMVSHELRAPLTTVTGSVELLGMCDPTSDPEAFREILAILEQQTRRLRSVIEEVLQSTRVEAGNLQVHLQPLALEPFLRSLVEEVRREWSGNAERLELCLPRVPVAVWADADLMPIVIRNLLENARKYAPGEQPIEVIVEEEGAAEPHRVRIRIVDHGPGIPPALLETIFDRFSRGEQSPTQWTRGYGLGLYITRSIVTAHHGAIWAENHGGGACFVLSLWSAVDEAVPSGALAREGGSGS